MSPVDVSSFFGGMVFVNEARVVEDVANAVRGGRIGVAAFDVDPSFSTARCVSTAFNEVMPDHSKRKSAFIASLILLNRKGSEKAESFERAGGTAVR